MYSIDAYKQLAEIAGVEEDTRLGHPLISGTEQNPNLDGPANDMELTSIILANRYKAVTDPSTSEFKLRKALIDVTINPYTGKPLVDTNSLSALELNAVDINRKPEMYTCGTPEIDAYNIWQKRRSLEARFAAYAQNAYCQLIVCANTRMWDRIINRFDCFIQDNIRRILRPIANGHQVSTVPGFFKEEIICRYKDGFFHGYDAAYASPYIDKEGDKTDNLASLLYLKNYVYLHPDTLCSILLAGLMVNFDKIRTTLSNCIELTEAYNDIISIFNDEQLILLNALENNVYMLIYEAKKYVAHGIPNFPGVSLKELEGGGILQIPPQLAADIYPDRLPDGCPKKKNKN